MVYLSCILRSIKMRTIISLVTVFFVFINLEMKAEILTIFINENQTASKDSINQTIEGKKEGYWIIYGKMRNLPDYKPDGIIEEGVFKSSRKQGLWKKYYPDGTIKSEIQYTNGRPMGEFKTYHPNGQVEEQGNWKGRVYTGNFERYYEDGTIAQKKVFNEKGKTEGIVEYYHTNGQLELSFSTANGKEEGTATRYWPNGDIKETIEFDPSGEGTSSGIIERVNPKVELEVTEEQGEGIIAVGETNLGVEQPSSEERVLKDGYHKTYNDNKDILMDGEFLGGKLWDGKHYIYDENGLLERIEVYKQGRYAGNGVL